MARRRHVQGRVLVEEADRLELESGLLDGHYRPVLEARHVRGAEDVPEDDVGAVELPVRPDPVGQRQRRDRVGRDECITDRLVSAVLPLRICNFPVAAAGEIDIPLGVRLALELGLARGERSAVRIVGAPGGATASTSMTVFAGPPLRCSNGRKTS